MKNKQASFIFILILIVLYIITLLRTSYDQYAEQKNLYATSLELQANNEQIAKLDTISMGLQDAENNFRMYTSLWDRKYFNLYNEEIKKISDLLESFSRRDVKNISDDISQDLAKKKEQVLLYTQIKKLTDSLMSVNLLMDTVQKFQVIKSFRPVNNEVVKKTVVVEEVKTETKKPKFFQRLKGALLNKELKDTSKNSRIETTYEKVPSQQNLYTKKQLDQVENFYKQLLEQQRGSHAQLSKKEQSILRLNEQILQNIKLMFKEFKHKELQLDEVRKNLLRDKTAHALKVIDRSGKISFFIGVFSFFIIILLLIKLYKTYLKILIANKKASEQVIFKSRFFTSISHEMRTPLNAIMGVTEQLKTTPLNAEQKSMSTLLETSSSMLLSAVNEILDFSRLESGKLTLSKVSFRYKKVLHDIIATTEVLAAQKNLKLVYNQDSAPDLTVMGDPYRLKQILLNLVANAIKFTDQGTVEIELKVKNTPGKIISLQIKIADTGIGISEQDLPYIFDEYRQVVHYKRIDWQKGSGLGLPICKKLIELHQGKINVRSTVGKGSVFEIELPYKISEGSDAIDTAEKQELQTDAFSGKKLLIVDDAEMNLLVTGMILKKQGIDFDTANTGSEALTLFEKNHYDMVLTDIQMPDMDGLELTRRIRNSKDQQRSNTPVLAVTGQISQEAHQDYLTAGMNDYLIKPYTAVDLIEKILDYLH